MEAFTTMSLPQRTKQKIDDLYIDFSKYFPMKKAHFMNLVIDSLYASAFDVLGFFVRNIQAKYPKDYDFVIAPIILTDVNNKTFYNIYSELREFNFNVLYMVSDKAKALIFLKHNIINKYL